MCFFKAPIELFSKFFDLFCRLLYHMCCRLLIRLFLLGHYSCKLALLVLYFLLLPHFKLLLLHAVVSNPKVDTEPYKVGYCLVWDKTQLITITGIGCYNILKFFFTYAASHDLPFTIIFLLATSTTRHICSLWIVSIYRTEFKLSEYCSRLTC
jgi:hypothetical protein